MSDLSEPEVPEFALMRVEYMLKSLDEKEVDPDPIRQFLAWLNEAIKVGANEPNAMTLATATRDGIPSARIVLLKGVDDRGLSFFTNYNSRKGHELAENPQAALLFFWHELERQVRFEGTIERTSAQESAEYFASRPVDAQVGSAASPQSEPIASREVLEMRQRELREKYPDGPIPCPPHWGGYRLRPNRMELWQGRASRVHDRIEYLRDEKGAWKCGRLAP